ncbi:MAG: 2OG-Fe(II) oxygenase [Pseudomonadota bacterium]
MSVAEQAKSTETGAHPPIGASEAETIFDLEALAKAPVKQDPYQYLVVPHFVRADALAAIRRDYPDIQGIGPVEPHEIASGPGFDAMVRALGGPEVAEHFARKFGDDIIGTRTVFKIRKWEGPEGGYIHTDSKSKLVSVLIYFNESWDDEGGRFRVLRSATDMDDCAEEILPLDGTLVAFRRCDHSYHGYKSYEGERRMIQMNYVDPAKLKKKDQGVAQRATRYVKSLFKTKTH